MCKMNMNEKLNGVELSFEVKPSEETLAELKALGFRWHFKKHLWYAVKNEERMALANRLTAETAAPVTEEAKEVPKTSGKVNKYGVKVGDIFYDTWGYEQTNVSFYKVTKVLGASKVEIVEIGDNVTRTDSWASGYKVADPDRITGEPIQKMVKQDKWEAKDGCFHITLDSVITLRPWGGQEVGFSSWY